MFRRSVAALLAVTLVCGSLKAADKVVMGKIVKVDADTKSVIVQDDDGKKHTFALGADTKFVDPKGNALKAGLKDKTLTVGATVKVVMTEKGANVKELQVVTAGSGTTKEPSKGTPAKVVKVDVDKRMVSVVYENNKKGELKLGEDVKFIGPRGGVSKEGIKDDRFVADAEIEIVMDKANKSVTEIHLPYRKAEKKDDKKDKDKKDK